VLQDLAKRDPRFRYIGLSRNFGHQVAITAGMDAAQGAAIVVMDADLQDPPELIAEFLTRWRQGYQVVYGIRAKRERETAMKKLTSFLFYRLMGKIADVPIPPDTGDFRLMDRRVLDVYAQLHEDPRFFRGLVSWVGFKQVGLPFIRRPRAAGYTKYRYSRLLKLAFDTITAFSTLPSLLISIMAMVCMSLSLGVTGVVLALWLIGSLTVPGWGWAALGFLALWNVQFLSLAVLGEYIVRTHRHTQHRPLYIVDAVIENGESRIASQPPERAA
jgi:dolichol-phosphate mannosyltransferase